MRLQFELTKTLHGSWKAGSHAREPSLSKFCIDVHLADTESDRSDDVGSGYPRRAMQRQRSAGKCRDGRKPFPVEDRRRGVPAVNVANGHRNEADARVLDECASV